MQSTTRDYLVLIVSLLVLVFAMLLNVFVGSVDIPFGQVSKALLGMQVDKGSWQVIIMDSRLPQALTAIFAGGGLALAGLLMQTLFNNYLAGPSVLGISSGSSLFVSITVILLGLTSSIAIAFSAIIGAIFVLLLIVALARKVKSNVTLLIVGLMLSFVTSALVSVLEYNSTKESLQLFVLWGLGSFSNISWQVLPIFSYILLFVLLASLLLAKPLNAMLIGEKYAKSMGVDVSKYRYLVLIITGVITGIITAFCGPIGFLGLAIPHVSRAISSSSDHLFLIPLTFVTGSTFGLVCDIISRLPGSENMLPINGVTALVGAPIVIWVILKNRGLN